jgi:hypothetical protein
MNGCLAIPVYQGPEFSLLPFQHVLMVNGLKDVPKTVANTQSNAINQTIENTMHTMLHTFQPQNPVEAATLLCYCP